jgi:hypothetical protein
MKITKLLLMWSLAIASLVVFQACNKDDDDVITPPVGDEVQLGVGGPSAFTKWFYFSFSSGEQVGIGDATAASDAEWKARTDWDIAFHMADVRTNSGVSGNGQGGVYDTGETDFNAVTVAPTSGYTVDTEVSIFASMPPTNLVCGVNETFVWTVEEGHGYAVVPKVFVVKTASGKYAKVLMKAIKDPVTGLSGVVTMEYSYQADGSTNLDTTTPAK